MGSPFIIVPSCEETDDGEDEDGPQRGDPDQAEAILQRAPPRDGPGHAKADGLSLIHI